MDHLENDYGEDFDLTELLNPLWIRFLGSYYLIAQDEAERGWEIVVVRGSHWSDSFDDNELTVVEDYFWEKVAFLYERKQEAKA